MPQMTRHHKTIAAIIAPPCHKHDTTALETRDVGLHNLQYLYSRMLH
jgi:hypothetical protein